jgi:hypothetical protein
MVNAPLLTQRQRRTAFHADSRSNSLDKLDPPRPGRQRIPKILIECGRFKFSENMSRIHLENGQKSRRGKNTVFNALC